MKRWACAVVVALLTAALGGLALWSSRLWPDPLRDAQAEYARGDYTSSMRTAREVLKEQPDSVPARRLLARSLARLGRRDYAQEMFAQIAREELEAEDYAMIGKGLLEQGQVAPAMRVFRLALEDDSQNPDALHGLAWLCAGTDRLAEAASLAQRLASQPGWEARGLVIAGLANDDAGDPARAIGALERALSISPDLRGIVGSAATVRMRLARDYLKLSRPEDATRILRGLPDDAVTPEVWWLRSRIAIQEGDRPAYDEARARAGSFTPGLAEPEPAAFVGAARCTDCHAEIARTQRGTRHAKTFRPVSALDELKLPPGEVVDPDNLTVKHTVRHDGQTLEQTTEAKGQTVRAWLKYAMGSGDRGMTPIGRDDQGNLRELRVSYYGDIGKWDRTTGHPGAADLATAHDYLGVAVDADKLRRCLGCHTTNPIAVIENAGPEAADRGMGCERCHGPGGNHLVAANWKLPDPVIGRPSQVTPAESTEKICAQCHSPRGRSPVPAGDPGEVRFQALTLPRSRCFTESRGAFGCVTCHNPHRDADTDPSYYETRCLACHAPTPPETLAAGVRPLPEGVERVPCPVEPATNCLECHMPKLRAAVPHTVFTDHHIRIHQKSPGVASNALP